MTLIKHWFRADAVNGVGTWNLEVLYFKKGARRKETVGKMNEQLSELMMATCAKILSALMLRCSGL